MRSTLCLSALHCRSCAIGIRTSHGDAMKLFMWQDDIIGVARFIDACLEKCTHQLALPWGTRDLISPRLAGEDAMILLLQVYEVHSVSKDGLWAAPTRRCQE
jgi:hypothetical protein